MKQQEKQFLNNIKMKKIVLSTILVMVSFLGFSQSVFDKYEDNEMVKSIIVNKKMFELMGKVEVDVKGEEKKYFDLIKKLDNLKVFITEDAKVANDMKNTVSSYLKSNPLEELMRITDAGKKVNIYVKSGSSNNIVKELLMYIESPNDKNNQAVVMSLTGSFNLDEISALTEKMSLPGGEQLKKASKK